MHPDLFTESWLERWRDELNASDTYRRAARHWAWPVVLVVQRDPEAGLHEERSVHLDLDHGTCRAVRIASVADRTAAPYVIEGDAKTWERILHRELDPVMALMQRKLHLAKGGLLALTRHLKAARELVAAAARATALEETAGSVAGPVSGAAPGRPIRAEVAGPRTFATMTPAGLDHDSVPMRLYHEAKRLGIWNPGDIDLSQDREDWHRLSNLEREVILHLTALFQAGEESVTFDILPLMLAVAREGRTEEELYLSTVLFEEAKHTEFFRRFLDEVPVVNEDLSRFHGPSYRTVFYEVLPSAMERLILDPSPPAQVEAVATYNVIVEGTLAETGYHAYRAMLQRNDLLPGLREGISLLKRDESRHIAYGLYLLGRHVLADPRLCDPLRSRMERLLKPALGVIHELFDAYESMPFGLVIDEFLDHAMRQFESWMARLEAVEGGNVNDVGLLES
jgi:ribonucleoside-diphosphate reductase beta chain